MPWPPGQVNSPHPSDMLSRKHPPPPKDKKVPAPPRIISGTALNIIMTIIMGWAATYRVEFQFIASYTFCNSNQSNINFTTLLSVVVDNGPYIYRPFYTVSEVVRKLGSRCHFVIETVHYFDVTCSPWPRWNHEIMLGCCTGNGLLPLQWQEGMLNLFNTSQGCGRWFGNGRAPKAWRKKKWRNYCNHCWPLMVHHQWYIALYLKL